MGEERSRVLLLGTYHMANPGRDRFNVAVDDIGNERRQREIEEVVDRLLGFRPTKVAVEIALVCADELNAEYRRYRAGTFDLPRDEVRQLGFRIAARSAHERLYPINMMVGRDIDPWEWAEQHGQAEWVNEMNVRWQALLGDESVSLEHRTMRENLRALNNPERGKWEQELYLLQAYIGAGDDYPGADWLAGWYERNLKIFANLTRITEPADRIFLLYGVGHVPLLKQFIRDSGMYDLEDVENYLS